MDAQCFSALPSSVRSFWAKSGDGFGHGLLAHMLDVAAVAEVLLEHEPSTTTTHFAGEFGLDSAVFVRCVSALVGLHDFGKAIPGFQAKWPEGQLCDEEAGLSFGRASRGVTDHACASAALLWGPLCQVSEADPGWVLGVLQGISAHHGYNFSRREINAALPPFEALAWGHAREALFDAYWKTLAPEIAPQAEELPLAAVQWLAGLTSVADWIGSNPDWFPFGARDDSFMAHFGQAKSLAAQALQEIGWARHRSLLTEDTIADLLISRIVGRVGITARPLQAEGDRLLGSARGPTLLLVEAAMGEGKTELAFLAHLRLQAVNAHRGLYVALPTQATGNALFDRALTFLRAFNHRQQLDIQLVHSGSMLDERVQRLRGISGERVDDIGSASWFSQRRRPLLSPYGVGTVDQALFATLNVKHHFVRLWGMANRVVVLDEVHAYDTYTSGLIEVLLSWLKALGSSVVVMSATLPSERRAALLQAWGVSPDEVPELPYPRLLLADSRGVRGATFESRPLASIVIRSVGEETDNLVACALQQLEHGGYGAVIVNTVDRAQTVYGQLRQKLDEGVALILFHARFPADERSEIERQVLTVFGQGGVVVPRAGRALLIATQVAEQSLDIDFDFLITDLAPIDLILQRAGRLHRHQRVRPQAHVKARLFVAGLDPQRLPELKKTAWAYVYEPYILGRTWALLSRERCLQLPQDIDRLVQAVYGDEPLPDDLEAKARDYITTEAYGQHLAHEHDERQRAVNIAINPASEPQYAYTDKPRGNEEGGGLGLTNRTRLGDDSITLLPVHRVSGGWSERPDGEIFDPQQPLSDALARRLYGRQLKLSRKEIVVHFSTLEAPPAFAGHPLLCHLKPLELDAEASCVIGKLCLRLDTRLGLVFEATELTIQPEGKE